MTTFSGQSPPATIQSRIVLISSSLSGSESFGMSALPSEGVTNSNR